MSDSVTLWTTACQAPLSMGFSREEHWSRLLCPPPGNLPHPEIEPVSLESPAVAGGFFTTSATCLRGQCKEIEENNRMGKTRGLIKKIRDTKGTFHAKMGTIKDRNGMDLTKAEDIKKRWQEYTEEKGFHNPDKAWWCVHLPRARHPGMWS